VILFVSNRERRMLSTIERVTRQKIAPLELPTAKIINAKRVETLVHQTGHIIFSIINISNLNDYVLFRFQ
jgi:hypothetical protein